jgi:ribonuclease D
MTEHTYISQQNQLELALPIFAQAQFLALDTEFIRRNTYKPILCLVQVMTDKGAIFLLDACKLDLAPFWQCLQDTSAVKVFHDSRQDLEIVWQESGNLPSPIFDTQFAALLLGLGESCGFGRLVEVELGVTLAKDQTATDWCQRPLTPAQIQYAIDDVFYLAQLYPQLITKLTASGQLSWIEDDNNSLTEPTLYQSDIIGLRKKLKAPPFFKREQRQRLDALLLWRETIAIEMNKPRQWIADNSTMIALAEHDIKHIDALYVAGLSPQTIRKYGASLLALLHNPPSIEEAKPLPDVDKEVLKPLRTHIDEVAAKLGLRQAAALVGKEELVYWLHTGVRPEKLTKGWRAAVLTQANSDNLVAQLKTKLHQLM